MEVLEPKINELRHLENMLISSKGELSPVLARSAFRDIKEKSLMHLTEDDSEDAYVLLANSSISELAKLETNPDARKSHRRKAISILRQHLSKESKVELFVALSNSVTDHFYDKYAQEETPRIQHELAEAKQAIKEKLVSVSDPQSKVMLLTQVSSILRCQSMISKPAQQSAFRDEAVRASKHATKEIAGHPFAHLEYAQAISSSARLAKSDQLYFEAMLEAEDSLVIAAQTSEALPLLALARFYRQTYRPALAVETFLKYEKEETLPRRLLPEAFVIAEAAIQLWYNDYSNDATIIALTEARRLLELSIDAGYENARILVSLATVEAALGESERAHSLLAKLAKRGSDDWLKVIDDAKDAISNSHLDVISRGFALGLSDDGVWNSLGTYAHEFLHDDSMAVQLYEVGLRLAPRNPVILTNMARSLIILGDEASLNSAKANLRKAPQNADRSFTWWRGVQEELDKKLDAKPILKPRELKVDHQVRPSYKEISKLFIDLDNDEIDKHLRGRQFQTLFESLLKITYGASVLGSHRVRGREVDAAFRWDGDHYRVETKWEAKPSGSPDFDIFRSKLDTANAKGVFVSMSGFRPPAIEAAKDISKTHTIILIDGDEIRNIMSGKLRLETVLESKITNFEMYGNPYFKVESKRA